MKTPCYICRGGPLGDDDWTIAADTLSRPRYEWYDSECPLDVVLCAGCFKALDLRGLLDRAAAAFQASAARHEP